MLLFGYSYFHVFLLVAKMLILAFLFPLRTEGGMKEIALHTNRQYSGGLVGCVSHFTLSTDYHLALVEDAADGKNINTCSN